MYLRLIGLVLLLGATGWLHGRWTDRWGPSADVEGAAATLPSVPMTVGDWQGRDITREEAEEAYRTGSPQILRQYTHRKTGANIGVLITCGRPSSMIIEHTPRTCYAELGFEELGAGKGFSVGPSAFYAHTFVKTSPVVTTRVRLLWSWGDGRTWSFPERPRIAFAKTPVLYKIYVTRQLLSEDEPLADDPARQFLEDALPQITAALSGGTR